VSCGTPFSQLGALAALEGPQDCVAEMTAAYKRRRDIALEVLRERGLYRYTPGGAFYVMVDVSATGMDSHDVSLALIREKRVAVGSGQHVRSTQRGAGAGVRGVERRGCPRRRQAHLRLRRGAAAGRKA
jgi:aspartate/methionine/tyrosine aminotransferase